MLKFKISAQKFIVFFFVLSTLSLSFQNCSKVYMKELNDSTPDSLAMSSCGHGEECPVLPDATLPDSCSFDGKSIMEGEFVTAFQNSTVPYDRACIPQIRTCNSGVLDGSFNYSACSVGEPASCLFNGQTIAHGGSVVAYQFSSVSSGSSCLPQTRICDDGKLSGEEFQFASCKEGAPKACIFNGKTIVSGEKVKSFESASVPFGQQCKVVESTCIDGQFSTPTGVAICEPGAPDVCSYNGRTVANGELVESYKSQTVPHDQQCEIIKSTCVDGQFSIPTGFVSCEKGTAPVVYQEPNTFTLPSNFSLTHVRNFKTFKVNWNAGSGNGGKNGCRLEYQKNDASWAGLINVNCDANGSDVGTVELPGDGWYGGSWSTVSVRLIRVSDLNVIGQLGNLNCSVKPGSSSATPYLDEDCNNIWDNFSSNLCERAVHAIGSFPTGSSYSVPSSITKVEGNESSSNGSCAGLGSSEAVPFYQIIWYKKAERHGPDSACTRIMNSGPEYGKINLPVTLFGNSGQVPETCGGNYSCAQAGCFFRKVPQNDSGNYYKWVTPGSFQESYTALYRKNLKSYK